MLNDYYAQKKPVLILHIGSGKTGTSALQKCMAKNQQFLMSNKICYSDFCEADFNHVNLGFSLIQEYFDKCDMQIDLRSPQFIYAPLIEPPANIINRIKNTFYKNSCDTIVISSELFFLSTGWLLPESANTSDLLLGRRKYLMNFFREAFKEFDIKIVCYLRRQDNYIESLYNQFCRVLLTQETYNRIFDGFDNIKLNGCKYKIPEDSPTTLFVKYVNNYLNCAGEYYANLSEWSEIYGKDNIIIRPYEKSQLPNGVEYDFFTNVLGLSENLLTGLNIYNEINVSMKKDLLEYTIATKSFDLYSELIALNEAPALAYLDINNKKNILTAKQAKHMLDYYKEDNEKIAREYLKRDDGILFYDKDREEKDDYPGLSMQVACDISKELILLLKSKNSN